jgi:U32 family peptidase
MRQQYFMRGFLGFCCYGILLFYFIANVITVKGLSSKPKAGSSSRISSGGIGGIHSIHRNTARAVQGTIQKKNKPTLPAIELINRRKSPALWRDDLSSVSSSSSSSSSTPQPEQPLQPQSQRQQQRIFSEPPEVMAPVGGWPQLHAALANGADSIYLGLSAFSARARATNFDPYDGELTRAVATCHDHAVRVYVALNTLVFDHEVQEVEGLIQACITAQVDALIVQDLGICQLAQLMIQQQSSTMELHASTQQTVTSADGVAFCAEQFGSTRVVLGRELSVAEIDMVSTDLPRKNHPTTTAASSSSLLDEVEIETFVHGALCVSYSGQCFSSEAAGGRSANRGQCAQACRLPYGLIDNGVLSHLGEDISYLLSPQDLCGLDHVPALLRAGVRCLKIEGRLKDATYVAATTRAYRQAVDVAWDEYCQEHGMTNTQSHRRRRSSRSRRLGEQNDDNDTVSRTDLLQVFSRGQDEFNNGLTPGFFEGSQHQRLVRGRSPRHRGVHVGRVGVGSSWKNGLVIDLDENDNDKNNDNNKNNTPPPPILKLGDGLVVDRGLAQEEELGGAIFELVQEDDQRNNNNNNNNNHRKRQAVIQFSRDVKKHWKQVDEMARHQGQSSTGTASTTDSTQQLWLAPVGAHVWKTHDAAVEKKMKRFATLATPKTTMASTPTTCTTTTIGTTLLSAKVSGRIGTPLQIELLDPVTGLVGIGRTLGELAPPERAGLLPSSITKAIGTLGNTESWTLVNEDGTSNIDMANVDDNVWCPMSWIKEARREAVEDLQRQHDDRSTDLPPPLPQSEPAEAADEDVKTTFNMEGKSILSELMNRIQSKTCAAEPEKEVTLSKKQAKLSVLARNYEQVDAICRMIEQDLYDGVKGDDIVVDEIYIDFLEVDGMQEAVTRIRQVPGGSATVRAVVASPRIIKPGESGIWRTLLRLEPDSLLVRSAGLLYRMMKLGGPNATVHLESKSTGNDDDDDRENTQSVKIPELIGDFSLNVANALTAHELLQYGCARVTASYDLRALAITELLDSMGGSNYASRVEIVTHAHMPIFHTEHCVFARFLSKGNSYLDCGHVCTRHNVHLRDQTGADNLVLADMGCRNTVFSAQAQSGVHSIREWRAAGANRFRIELVDESAEDTQVIVRGYEEVLKGVIKPKELWETLERVRDSNGRQGGVSLGSFRNLAERRAGEIK